MASISQNPDYMLSQLKQALKQTPINEVNVKSLLHDLKVAITSFDSFGRAGSVNEREVNLIRDIYETACQYSILVGDYEQFERHVKQLQPYYRLGHESVQQAENRKHILGLYLTYLLISANTNEFYCQLESISENDRTSPYISFPLSINAYLQEGNYNKVLEARLSNPGELFKPFMESFTNTVRKEIAACAEVAYQSWTLDLAKKLLFFNSTTEVLDFIRSGDFSWSVEGNIILFNKSVKPKEIDSLGNLGSMVKYATDLERII